jgi:hypothetical protein
MLKRVLLGQDRQAPFTRVKPEAQTEQTELDEHWMQLSWHLAQLLSVKE